MILHKIDPLTGRYAGDVVLGDDPPLGDGSLSPVYIGVPIPSGMKVPRWEGDKWVDDYVQTEPFEESLSEKTTIRARLEALESATLALILGE